MIRIAIRHGDRRWHARVIRLWDRTDASHCEIAYAWQGRQHNCISSSALDGGVRSKSIELDPARWRVYELDRSAADALAWFARHEGEDYDWLGLIGFVLRPYTGIARHWFCSEACAAMLGLPEPWRYSPRTLELLCAQLGRRVQLT